MAQKSLVETIRHLEAPPDYVLGIYRVPLIRRVFDTWEQHHPYLRNVRARRTTLSDEYERIFGQYDGWRALIPQRMPESLRQDGKEFVQACGGNLLMLNDHLYARYGNMLMTPPGSALVFGLGFALIGSVMTPEIAAWPGLLIGGVVGATGGLTTTSIEFASFRNMRTNAAYLDRKIEEAYR